MCVTHLLLMRENTILTNIRVSTVTGSKAFDRAGIQGIIRDSGRSEDSIGKLYLSTRSGSDEERQLYNKRDSYIKEIKCRIPEEKAAFHKLKNSVQYIFVS